MDKTFRFNGIAGFALAFCSLTCSIHAEVTLKRSSGITHQTVQSAVPSNITLNQAETIALRQAPSLGQAMFTAQAAKQVTVEERSGFFPQIVGDVIAVGANRTNVRIGASGGLNNPTILSRQSDGINVSQMLFDFGKTLNLTEAANYQALSEAQREQQQRALVLLNVDRAYFNLLKARALLRVANETVASRQIDYDEINALATSKLKSDLDVTYARSNLEQAKQLVLEAENAVEIANAELSNAMGYSAVHQFSLNDQPAQKFTDEKVGTLIEEALQIRPEVMALRDEVSSAQRLTAAEKAARLPHVDLLGSFGRTTIGDSDVQGNYAAAGIDLEVPLFTGGLLSARQREASLKAQAAQKSLQDEEDQVVKEVNASWYNAFTALKNIDVADTLASTADQALDLAQAQYKAGQTSIIEFSQAQLNALQAEIAAASAKYDYEIDRASLDYEVGLLAYRGQGQVFTGIVPAKRR